MTAPTPPPCPGSGRMVNPGPSGPPRYFCCCCGTELDARDLEGGGKGAGGIWAAKPHVSPWWRAPVIAALTEAPPPAGEGEGG